MKFSEADSGSGHIINGYEAGCVIIDGREYREGLIVSPERIVRGWGPDDAIRLAIEHIQALLDLDPQVIVIGTGARQVLPHPHLYCVAADFGVGIEIMDTGAACRTYNIIMAEGRKVAAGLLVR
jgi:uncharacterized protein